MRITFLKLALAILTANAVLAVPTATDIDVDEDTFTDADVATLSSAKSTTFGNTVGSFCGCTLLSIFAFGKVHYPGSSKYEQESTTKFWSETSWNTPKCVFIPTTTKDVAKGVKIMDLCEAEFAIRGGGHMPTPEFTNTRNGILFALSGLNTLSLSSTKQSVSVGPANNWGQVYNYLSNSGLYVLGGRLSPVGVPGLILGGGINFFSNKYGFAMDNVLSFEVVLASGKIVTATVNSYSDLFWALKGGSSNFGIITKFELKTYAIPKAWSRMGTFMGEDSFNTFYSALVNFTNSGYTTKGAGIIPQINFQPSLAGDLKIGVHVLVHEGDVADPPIFGEFNKIQKMQDMISIAKPANVSDFLGATGIPGKRHVFRVQSSLATMEAAKWTHSTFYSWTDKLKTLVPSLQSAGIAFQPISASTIAAGAASGGNSFGIKSGENYFWYAMSINWDKAEDDDAANTWLAGVGEAMSKGFAAKNLTGNDGREFLYMNDAQGRQDVFAGYGPTQVTKLKAIRQKYDQGGKMFGKNGRCKGGFKLPL